MAKKIQPRRVRTDPFEAIAEEAVVAAEAVKCSQGDFKRGLDTIVKLVRDRYDLVVDELRGHDDSAAEDDDD